MGLLLCVELLLPPLAGGEALQLQWHCEPLAAADGQLWRAPCAHFAHPDARQVSFNCTG